VPASSDPAPARDGLGTWWWAIAAFAVAALTGSLLRFGMLHGLPFGLTFVNVRHAHSHLMYFSWVTPALMLLMMASLRRSGLRVRGAWVAPVALACGASTFVPFLVSGYGTVDVGGRALPLSMITSGLNGLAWYAFVGVYAAATWGRVRTLALRAFDASLFLLVLASMGALGLAGTAFAGAADPAWMLALVDFFLDLFGDGWFTLGLLGLAYASLAPVRGAGVASRGVEILTLGLVLRSLAALAAPMGGAWLPALAAAGTAASGVGLLLCVWPLWRSGGAGPWALPIAFLTAKGVVELGTASPAVAASIEAMGLRVFLLHAFLLGAVTLGLVAAARALLGRDAARYPGYLSVAVLALLVSLLPLTGAWPWARGAWVLPVAAWLSLAPSVALVALAWRPPVRDVSRRGPRPAR
jgi:hypothetical protein